MTKRTRAHRDAPPSPEQPAPAPPTTPECTQHGDLSRRLRELQYEVRLMAEHVAAYPDHYPRCRHIDYSAIYPPDAAAN